MSNQSVPGKIFIGGMPYSLGEPDLKDAFEKFGTVTDCKCLSKVIMSHRKI